MESRGRAAARASLRFGIKFIRSDAMYYVSREGTTPPQLIVATAGE